MNENNNYGSDECSSIESIELIDNITENLCILCETERYYTYKSIFQTCQKCDDIIYTPYTNNYAFFSLLNDVKNYYFNLENDHYLLLINYFTNMHITNNENQFEL